MGITRRIAEHRSVIVLILLVVLSLTSLASGTRGGTIDSAIRGAVEIAKLPFLKVMAYMEGGIGYITGPIIAYDKIVEENKALRLEKATFLTKDAAYNEWRAENERLTKFIGFKQSESGLTLQPARVMTRYQGILTIDRGSVHGIRASMSVISSDGVVGLVTRVHWKTSNVITLQNANCKIDAMVLRTRVRGSVQGTGSDLSRICTMTNLYIQDDVRENDAVVTSPDSVFPGGLPIGRVRAVQRGRETLLQTADIVPAVDPYQIEEVFVVIGADLKWENLAGLADSPGGPGTTEELLDTQTLQERYAP